MVTPRRGDLFWVNLDPTVGTEIRKKRPAIIISNNAANRRYHQVTVIPLTSQKIQEIEPFQVYVAAQESGLQKESKALAEQIRTVSKLRLGSRIGNLSTETLTLLEKAIQIHLDLK
ncbi:MAG: type II toxin-antitoxin system PemK/MazF family toxin [Deltaproteobacteria bacterium]|nr:type II toxin-antitoxin system PemK/MazF family toxin [Deltaproteobacteria bacterium]